MVSLTFTLMYSTQKCCTSYSLLPLFGETFSMFLKVFILKDKKIITKKENQFMISYKFVRFLSQEFGIDLDDLLIFVSIINYLYDLKYIKYIQLNIAKS